MKKSAVEIGVLNVYLSSQENGTSSEWFSNDFPLQHEISRQPDVLITPRSIESNSTEPLLNLKLTSSSSRNTNTRMRGMGTSLDGASISHLKTMTSEQRKDFLTTLLDPINGVGFTQFRLVIGTCDFNFNRGELFSYYDKIPEGEPNWDEDFSIQPDVDMGLIDIIKEIQSMATDLGISEEIRFLASPWSPPGWMKENISPDAQNNELNLIGGNLKEEHVKNWAIYLKKYIEEYAKLDIPINAITLQNEPILNNITYPNCQHTGQQQGQIAKILKEELENSPIIQQKGYKTELWAWDFIPSKSQGVDEFLQNIELEDPGLASFDGIAFHGYHISPSHIKTINEHYPDLEMHITEAMEPGTFGATRVIQMLRTNCSSYHHWVTTLDSDRQPNEWGNSSVPGRWFFLALSVFNGERYWFLPTKNLLGQISKFVRPGCVMLETERWPHYGLEHIAYQDLINDNIIIVVVNNTDNDYEFPIGAPSSQGYFQVTIPSKTMGTYIYSIRN